MKAEEVYGSLLGTIEGVASGLVSSQGNPDGTITLTYSDGTVITTNPIKGDKGDAFEYDDFTPEQLEALRGDPGKGVYVGTTEPTDSGVIIWLDPDEAVTGSGALLEQELKATVEIGTVTMGKTYARGTKLENIIRDMLIKEEAPKVTLALNPTATLYDVVSQTLSTIVLSATVTKQTYDPKTVKFYVDDTLVNTKTITAGGTYSYTYTFSPATNVNHTFKVVASDGKLSSNATKTIKFVGNTYYGIVASDIGTPTASQIKALSKTLKDVKGYTWDGITTDFGKVVYAYPVSFGALASIKDPVNNFTYTDSFTRSTVSVDGIDYYVYIQAVASASDNVKLVFA